MLYVLVGVGVWPQGFKVPSPSPILTQDWELLGTRLDLRL